MKNEKTDERDDVVVITFKTPISYNEEEYNELTFDFEKLTGKDGIDARKELRDEGVVVLSPITTPEYLYKLAAKACSAPIGSDIFEYMPLKYANKVENAVRNFIVNAE